MVYKRILIIDDDEDDQRFIAEAVEVITHSAVVTVFDNAVEAIKKLAARQIIADLIFLDLNMPLMHGNDFLREIRKAPTLRDIPIVILTGVTNTIITEAAMNAGATDVILKPSSVHELVEVLQPFLSPVPH